MTSYGPHRLQTIATLDLPSSSPIVFIHGGAWRDPNNTKDDWDALASMIEPTPGPYKHAYSLDYRLSPEVKHPQHILDVLFALCHLKKEVGVEHVSLAGHSVGATLILQILSFTKLLSYYPDTLTDLEYLCLPVSVKTPAQVVLFIEKNLPRLDTLYLLDGIYDMDKLYEEYPIYSDFMGQAFNGDESQAIQLSLEIGMDVPHGRVVVAHSYEDELLSPQQTFLFTQYLTLQKIEFTFVMGSFGKHNEVYECKQVAELILKEAKV
ncbi:hypothetical protein BABINDRAFT_34382 [Babjeviella inositovora NRRL Y-12698]|uniref:Alpha/beta hydrolase fold-3 domain-containing protein n=1 Tax=Babjeviella inositovora NRRL Y-12698 TaxID=984486 RepID=A0A1E3QU28_9ASCO|nr:uncharacterized protein BABINDRAFT_34382 [Babjeviella inositovora NRRL Y-12698]ODQ81196.1 hypothetical protein BABINDRAFT_34382 [Babjeviella inositovora NRRL Y-12698]